MMCLEIEFLRFEADDSIQKENWTWDQGDVSQSPATDLVRNKAIC